MEQLVVYLEKEDKELAKVLMNFGIRKNKALGIAYFLKNKYGTTKMIQDITNLPQPEVSSCTSWLKSLNWLDIEKIRHDDSNVRGRPKQSYKFKATKNDVIHHFEYMARIKVNEIENKLKQLNEIRV